MSRLTVTLDDDLHRALKETAARQGRSIASIIEESLRLRGIQSQASARSSIRMRPWGWLSRRHVPRASNEVTRLCR